MSNGSTIDRLWKLQTKANMLVLDGKRDLEHLCELYQNFISKQSFSPAVFIGKGWSYAESRNARSAALGLLEDYSRVELSTEWLQGAKSVDGETRRRRILENATSVALNCDHFLDLWNNKEKIPELWKEVSTITFDGDVLQDPGGDRSVLCLCWHGSGWSWDCDGIDDRLGVLRPSALLAS